MTNPIPQHYHTVTPYLVLKDAHEAVEFYKSVFGATEVFRLMQPDGMIGHVEVKIGDSIIMISDACSEDINRADQIEGAKSIALLLYVEDVDAQFAQAVNKGARVIKPVQDQFYGDRTCTVQDPFGQVWIIATHKEDLTPEEIDLRAEVFFERIPQD